MRLFRISGLEFMDYDNFEDVSNNDLLFYSFSNYCYLTSFFIDEDFDYSVCMEFLTLKNKLGQGGFGSVYLGWDGLNKREVAVKIISSGDNIYNSTMMYKEIEALRSLNHKNIVKFYHSFPLPKK